LEDLIGPRIDETVQATARALNSAGVRAADLTGIVLVGGSSRIPLVAERLAAAFRCPVTKDTDPKYDIALGAVLTTAKTPRQADSVDPGTAVETAGAGRVDETKHRDRRRLVKIVAAAAAVATVVVLGVTATKLISSASDSGPVSNTASAASSAVEPTTGSVSAAPTGSTGPTATEATSSSLPITSAAPTRSSPTVPAPATFDETTIWWFTTICTAAADMSALALIPGTTFPNASALQSAYQHLFQMQASIAESAAAALSAQMPVVVAGGRIDAQASLDGMQNLADVITGAGRSMKAFTPTTGNEVLALAKELRGQIAAANDSGKTDIIALTTDEVAFVGSLRGCENVR
jgi:hypothetical protein